ncbi:hypothetical protein Q9S36_20055 [Microbacterium sp. ARD31]|uniref:hypothetical protein n=1 Tax=Microbacterium sp. ARD31 TaxID=2962576 RepID=UPI002880C952|nr:hypothetical protein [Microbacterium sp. ARD31]MDT0182474.1 hypothetical protein [Microbacterium sp. ARD31]
MRNTMKIRVTSQFTVTTDDDLANHLDALIRSLVEIEGRNRDVSESDVSAVLSRGVVEMSTVIATDSWESADLRAEGVFEEAIRLAGGRIDGSGSADADLTARIRSTEMVPA